MQFSRQDRRILKMVDISLARYSCRHRGANNIKHQEKIAVSEEERPETRYVPIWGIFLLFLGIG